MDAETIATAQNLMAQNLWAVYLGIFFGPFVQEDAAIIGGASLAAAGMTGPAPAILLTLLAGLTVSDLWKYWIGTLARSRPWARRLAEGRRVSSVGALIGRELGKTILVARFLPGTRIALYIAAGYFRVSFARFAMFIVASGACVIASLYLLFELVGDVVGERASLIVASAAIAILVMHVSFKVAAARLRDRASATKMG